MTMKSMKPKNARKPSQSLLSDRIVDSLTVKPRPDIEDDQVFGTKPKTVSRADLSSTDSEDDALISDFKKRNVSLLSEIDKKYSGEVVPRKQFLKDDGSISSVDNILRLDPTANQKVKPSAYNDSLSSESDDESDYDNSKVAKVSSNDSSDAEMDSEITDGKSNDENTSSGSEDNEVYDISQMEEPQQETFEHMSKKNLSEEAKKGSCVKNQLLIWEGLLEMRIHIQRCMNAANQMPMHETYRSMKLNSSFSDESNKVKMSTSNLLDRLLTLQNLLLASYPETKSILKSSNVSATLQDSVDNKIDDDEEIPSDTESEDNIKEAKDKPKIISKISTKKRKLGDYERELSETNKAFKSFRDSTIEKWHEKTRITSANVKNAPTNSIIQQISYILSDRDKLLRRTQLKRSDYDIIGYNKESIDSDKEQEVVNKDRKSNDEYIPEIFDDSDFYHQLLRELIECKSADVTDPVQLSRQWIALQQMRSKVKRKVDTKATKGRKIKYVVHNKLVNFMAPEKNNLWTDESTNELFSSLFGKMFERDNVESMNNASSDFKLING